MSTLRERIVAHRATNTGFPFTSTIFIFAAILGGGMLFIGLPAVVQLLVVITLAAAVTLTYVIWATRR